MLARGRSTPARRSGSKAAQDYRKGRSQSKPSTHEREGRWAPGQAKPWRSALVAQPGGAAPLLHSATAERRGIGR
jgi:hypothetical protein